jgi:hypothetical protein
MKGQRTTRAARRKNHQVGLGAARCKKLGRLGAKSYQNRDLRPIFIHNIQLLVSHIRIPFFVRLYDEQACRPYHKLYVDRPPSQTGLLIYPTPSFCLFFNMQSSANSFEDTDPRYGLQSYMDAMRHALAAISHLQFAS